MWDRIADRFSNTSMRVVFLQPPQVASAQVAISNASVRSDRRQLFKHFDANIASSASRCSDRFTFCQHFTGCFVTIWLHGVTVSTLDSESSGRGSNPRRTFAISLCRPPILRCCHGAGVAKTCQNIADFLMKTTKYAIIFMAGEANTHARMGLLRGKNKKN